MKFYIEQKVLVKTSVDFNGNPMPCYLNKIGRVTKIERGAWVHNCGDFCIEIFVPIDVGKKRKDWFREEDLIPLSYQMLFNWK